MLILHVMYTFPLLNSTEEIWRFFCLLLDLFFAVYVSYLAIQLLYLYLHGKDLLILNKPFDGFQVIQNLYALFCD